RLVDGEGDRGVTLMPVGIRGMARDRVRALAGDLRAAGEWGCVERGRRCDGRLVRADDGRDVAVEERVGRDGHAAFEDLDRGRGCLEGERVALSWAVVGMVCCVDGDRVLCLRAERM